jgi:uncharacterized protein YkwD
VLPLTHLRRSIAVLTVLVAGAATLVAGSPAPASASTVGPSAEAQAILAQTNQLRAQVGAPPLALCANLTDAAQLHSADQASRSTMSHTGGDGSSGVQRAERAGYVGWTAFAENVAFGFATPEAAMAAWTASGGHYLNLVNPAYQHLGVGLARSSSGVPYWTQDFGTSGSCGQFYDPNAFGAFELAISPAKGYLRVGGWAADRDAGSGPVEVHVYVSGTGHNLGLATLQRSDVGSALGLGAGHGFDTTFAVTPGSHTVCAFAINVGPGANGGLGCRTVWVPDPASPFLDLLASSPFFPDVTWSVRAGLSTGYPDGTYRPAAPVTRQAMASFLWKASGSPTGPFPDPGFPDVGATHPFRTPIAWMASTGLATGYDDGLFRPGAVVSRQATAAFLWRLEGQPTPPTAPAFSDVATDNPFREAIRWAAAGGITTGYRDGTFRPGLRVSRQAMAAFLHRWQT